MNWHQHNGTTQPTTESTQVLIRRRDGSYDTGKASEFRWERRYLGGDARDITDWCEVVEPRYPTPIPIARPAEIAMVGRRRYTDEQLDGLAKLVRES